MSFLFAIGHTSAQFLIANTDSTVTSSVYAGMLSSALYQCDTNHVNKFGDLRVGFKTVWIPGNKIECSGFFTTNITDGAMYSLYSLRVKYRPSKKLMMTAGLAPTLATELRAEVTTADGQFEPWSLSRLPGVAPSIKMKYSFSGGNGIAIGAGVASRNDTAEYHVYFGLQKITAVAYMRDHKIGTGVTYQSKRFYQFLSYDAKDVIAGVSMYTLTFDSIGRNNCALYCDFGTVPKYRNRELAKLLPRFEIGVLKFYYFKHVSGLFGISYCREINSVKGYLFLHL